MGTVVVGVDGSDSSVEALRFALGEARLRGARLRVVHAWAVRYVPALTGPTPLPEAGLEAEAAAGARRILDASLSAIAGQSEGVEVVPVLAEGGAARVLVAESRDADLLVVGSRGRGGFGGLLLGSVGQQCAHAAACPVAIVRPRGRQ